MSVAAPAQQVSLATLARLRGPALALLGLGLVALPLPAVLIDGLLLLGLAAAVALLGLAVSAGELRRVPRFPALLLWVLLLRFGLSVAALRLLLSEGHAGWVVESIGALLGGGDLLVGAALLVVLLGGQQLLLSRGGERLAEVAARFALDALPGQQAAIEADLRAGSIQPQEAQARRRDLLERAQLYGAMDGALRLLRGDWAALLLVLAVGLAAGVAAEVRSGGALGEALSRIGPLLLQLGLVTQIPVLAAAVAAGLLLTGTGADQAGAAAARPAPPAAERLTVEVGAALAQQVTQPRLRAEVSALSRELGLPLPEPVVAVNADGPALGLRARAGDVRLVRRELAAGEDPVAAVLQALRERAADLLRLEDVQRLVSDLGARQPALLQETVPRRIELPLLTEVLRLLLKEGVAPLPVAGVLEAVSVLQRPAQDPALLTEQVRGRLGWGLVQAFLTPDEQLRAFVLDVEVEELLRDAALGAGPAVEPEILRELVSQVEEAQGRAPGSVLLCQGDVRPRVRGLLARLPAPMPVLGMAELPAQLQVSVVGYIGPSGLRGA